MPEAGLTIDGCRARQRRLCEALAESGLDGALLAEPRYVHALTGYWCRPVFAAVAVVAVDGRVTLVAPAPPEAPTAADDVIVYESNRLGTLVDDLVAAALEAARGALARLKQAGCDALARPIGLAYLRPVDITALLTRLRRAKDADEVQLIARAVRAAEAAYAHARQVLCPGLTEIDLYAEMLAAAVRSAGEPVGDFGNDFQIGALGSLPRSRPAQAGEVAILDVSVTIRGYRSDLCRSLVVGGEPTQVQRDAHARVVEVLDMIATRCRAGASCRDLYAQASALLEGHRGWTFPHHLGHGIGLSPHEAPRFNPRWDETLQVGDVFTLEPGLYGPDLLSGVRVEENYHLGRQGLTKLSTFSTALA